MGYEPVDEDHAIEAIGVSVHTALRHGPAQDMEGAHELWVAIFNFDGWEDAIRYANYTLNESGLQICAIPRKDS